MAERGLWSADVTAEPPLALSSLVFLPAFSSTGNLQLNVSLVVKEFFLQFSFVP